MLPSSATEFDRLMDELQMNELEPADEVLHAHAYMKLLAIYLYQNDLCNAKFLWKRIPSDMKTAHEDLGRIWNVGQHMWQRNWSAVHEALDAEWSEDVKSFMIDLKYKVRERVIKLISKAYSSLSLTSMAQMSGVSVEKAKQIAKIRGWSIDDNIVQPCKQIDEEQYSPLDICLTEEQLEKLTQFVSFLEN